jgi:lipopolysaccharide/colanic/teichoic acid biosynthesis glycosyltransferase
MPSHEDYVQRAFDIALSLVIAAAAIPVVILSAIAIAVVMGRPVLFRQTRIGRNEQPFELYKFRTMRQSRGSDELSSDAERLTALGQWLRKTSLDELPQLWNVLKGDMSLVGPRPLLPQYLTRYTEFQRRRHEVRPGVTGWAQVNGRNAISWEDKFRLDVWYVDRRSLRLDCTILLLTLRAVLTRRGVAAGGHVTAPEFQGSVARE